MSTGAHERPTARSESEALFVLWHAAITLLLVLVLILVLALADDGPRDFTMRGFEGESGDTRGGG